MRSSDWSSDVCSSDLGDLILDNLGRLPWVWRADDDLNIGKVRQRINSGVLDRPDTPGHREHSSQQDQKAIGHRPSDYGCDHCWPPSFSIRSITRPSSLSRTPTRIRSSPCKPDSRD